MCWGRAHQWRGSLGHGQTPPWRIRAQHNGIAVAAGMGGLAGAGAEAAGQQYQTPPGLAAAPHPVHSLPVIRPRGFNCGGGSPIEPPKKQAVDGMLVHTSNSRGQATTYILSSQQHVMEMHISQPDWTGNNANRTNLLPERAGAVACKSALARSQRIPVSTLPRNQGAFGGCASEKCNRGGGGGGGHLVECFGVAEAEM